MVKVVVVVGSGVSSSGVNSSGGGGYWLVGDLVVTTSIAVNMA